MSQPPTPIITDSVTSLGPAPRGQVALAASHGGCYAAYLAAAAGLKGVILCDAGVGRERAGIAGLDDLAALGMPAAALDYQVSRIGDGADCARRGIVSFANALAEAHGVVPGMTAQEALARLTAAVIAPPSPPPPQREARHRIDAPELAGVAVLALDSNALVTPEDAGAIIVTGSHGGLLGGRPETAVRQPVFAAIYNDAGIGSDQAGISRLPALEARGIAGATVSAFSARIGDGLSTYHDGIVSALNAVARRHGGEIGLPAAALVTLFAHAKLARGAR